MFVLFHSVPYEGEGFVGVFESLELTEAAGREYVDGMKEDGFDSFYGRLEAYPYEPGTAFKTGFMQAPVWTFSAIYR